MSHPHATAPKRHSSSSSSPASLAPPQMKKAKLPASSSSSGPTEKNGLHLDPTAAAAARRTNGEEDAEMLLADRDELRAGRQISSRERRSSRLRSNCAGRQVQEGPAIEQIWSSGCSIGWRGVSSQRNANTGWGSKEDIEPKWEHDKHRGPSNKGGVCYAFQKGECSRGDSYRFSHDEQVAVQNRGVCYAFQTGECSRGASCRFSHDEQI